MSKSESQSVDIEKESSVDNSNKRRRTHSYDSLSTPASGSTSSNAKQYGSPSKTPVKRTLATKTLSSEEITKKILKEKKSIERSTKTIQELETLQNTMESEPSASIPDTVDFPASSQISNSIQQENIPVVSYAAKTSEKVNANETGQKRKFRDITNLNDKTD